MSSPLEEREAVDTSTLSVVAESSIVVSASASASESAAPSTPTSTSFLDPTPIPTSAVPEPSPTDDQLDSDGTYPPMTTPWTAPLSCTWTYNADRVPEPGATGPVAWLDLEPVPGDKSLSCYPNGMFTEGRTGVFSPGTCPNGWTTVSLRVETNEIKDEETTTAVCCSSEYYLDGNWCKRSVPTVLAVPITYNHTARTYDILSDSTTTLYSATIAVYTIRALFKEEDKDALGLKDEDDIGTERSPNSLSLGARIGIGVGVGAFVLLRKRSHELNAMRSRHHGRGGLGDDFYIAGNGHPRRAEPPPAYEAATDSHSTTDNDSRLSGDTTTRDEEIRALQVQKAAIQRRIEELERSETNHTQEENRENRQQ
ncbi:hypothetical protein ACJ41O_002379 [Fusarium nematophilum]